MTQDTAVKTETQIAAGALAAKIASLLTPKEAGVILHLPGKKLRKLARDGKIARSKLANGRVMFEPAEIERFKNQLIEDAKNAKEAADKKALEKANETLNEDNADNADSDNELELDDEDEAAE